MAQAAKDGLHHFLSVVLPRISPQSILKQVLGPWILIPEFPRKCSYFQSKFHRCC